MKKVELMEMVSGVRTAVPVSVDCVYESNGLLKRNNPYVNAVKSGTISGMIGVDYTVAVNNQLGREDKELDFFAQPHAWMVPAERNLGKNGKNDDGKRYIAIKVQSASPAVYTLDGVDVTAQVKPFVPLKKAPATQDALEQKVIWRTVCLNSIKTVRMLGAVHTISE